MGRFIANVNFRAHIRFERFMPVQPLPILKFASRHGKPEPGRHQYSAAVSLNGLRSASVSEVGAGNPHNLGNPDAAKVRPHRSADSF